MAKIVVIVRTRNEHNNIARFCRGYSFADQILVADGGSCDDTVSLALQFPNVKVRNFDLRVEKVEGFWRNPEGKHWDFLHKWALEEGADWILHDDCDSFPTYYLKKFCRKGLESASLSGYKVCLAYHIYVWGTKHYFPDMNLPGPALYGFTSDSGIQFNVEEDWTVDIQGIPKSWEECYIFDKPHCRLHYYTPDSDTVERKLEFYRRSGQFPELQHPLEANMGKILPLEYWMVE